MQRRGSDDPAGGEGGVAAALEAPPLAPTPPSRLARPLEDLAAGSVAVVLGTRPEIIKLAGIVRLLGRAAWVLHTGQHFDVRLAGGFHAELGLPTPEVQLEVGGTSRGHQIGEATRLLDQLFGSRRPALVVVQGDTNAVLAGALAANARDVPVCHVEAGLRSRDRTMPEEHNRVLTDHLSEVCCAPTETSRTNLAAEGIGDERVVVTGNTVVEAVTELLPSEPARRRLLVAMGLSPRGFLLSTFHRPENVDDPRRLEAILRGLSRLPLPALLPLHPRTARRLEEFGLTHLLAGLRTTAPLGYRRFLALAAESAFLLSDSGGVQEEVSVLKRRVLVVRGSTERPEVLGTFAELLRDPEGIPDIAGSWARSLEAIDGRLALLPSPYGDGSASLRCVAAMLDRLGCGVGANAGRG